MIMDLLNMLASKNDCQERYAIVGLQCDCRKPNLVYLPKNRRFYCKNCGMIVTPVLVAGMYRDYDELVESVCEHNAEPDHTDTLLERISALESELADRDAELDKSYETIQDYRNRLATGEMKIGMLKKKAGSIIQQLNKEISRLETDLDSKDSVIRHIEGRCSELTGEISEINRTNTFLRTEMRKQETFDLREITAIMMEYAASIGNIVAEKDEPETIRELVSARTSQLCMKLEGQGLSVDYQSAGEELRDGRVDTTVMETDNPAKNGRVLRSVRYGCRFRDDIYAPVVENVIVNRLVQKKEGEE